MQVEVNSDALRDLSELFDSDRWVSSSRLYTIEQAARGSTSSQTTSAPIMFRVNGPHL